MPASEAVPGKPAGSASETVVLPIALEDAVERFAAFHRGERAHSEKTVESYRADLRLLLLEDPERLPDRNSLSTSRVRKVLARSLRDGKSPSSVARYLAAFRGFARYCRREGWVDRDLARGLVAPKRRKSLVEVLSKDDLLRAIEGLEALIQASAEGADRHRALRGLVVVELLWGSGVRLSELVGLDWHDIDLEARQMRVTGKGKKTRLVPLTDPAHRSLQRWLGDPVRVEMSANIEGRDRSAVFPGRGGRLTGRTIELSLKSDLEGAVRGGATWPHALRHSFATHMLDGGADIVSVKELLGHANLTTTQVYTHVSVERLRKAHAQAHPRG